MSRKATLKKYVSVLIAFALVVGSIVGINNYKTKAMVKKTIGSVRVMQGGKNVTKKTLKMNVGDAKKLTVKAKTKLSKEEIKFSSSNKEVVTVNKNGKLTAKESGSARITVTVSKKALRQRKHG